jgi:hypothetical protein
MYHTQTYSLKKIRNSVSPSRPFTNSILEFSKNPGIAFISLDASEEKLQLFHHVSLTGGSWTDNKETIVGVLGSGSMVIPIQIMSSSIKEVKGKSYSFDQFVNRIKLNTPMELDRSAKSEFYNHNILPIPALLTQVFLNLEELDPLSVASAFLQAMYQFDTYEEETKAQAMVEDNNSLPDSKNGSDNEDDNNLDLELNEQNEDRTI